MREDNLAEAKVLMALALERVGRHAETLKRALAIDNLLQGIQPDKRAQELLLEALTDILINTYRALDAMRSYKRPSWLKRDITKQVQPPEE